MNPKLEVFLSILSSVTGLLSNPVLGGTGTQQVIGVLQYAAYLVKEASATVGDLKVVDDQIKTLVAEGRPPTAEEWAAWDARLRSVDERFARVKESL